VAVEQHGIELVAWNPLRARPGLPWYVKFLGITQRANNFGDLLGPEVVRWLLSSRDVTASPGERRRLLTVGSVMHLARPGDVVWGTGINGKELERRVPYGEFDIRAVRGPLTRDILRSHGVECPAVYGDPALLLGRMLTREQARREAAPRRVAVVPNLNDAYAWRRLPDAVDPRLPWREVVSQIAASEFVVASSLHAVIVAEALGVGARAVSTRHESPFKYEDYYAGTGRPLFEPSPSVEAALDAGPVTPPDWDPAPLLDAFPWDLWEPASPDPHA
jgi:pyruvyltransferase